MRFKAIKNSTSYVLLFIIYFVINSANTSASFTIPLIAIINNIIITMTASLSSSHCTL